MDVAAFDYSLPKDRIAQTSIEPRDQAKLLTLNRQTGELSDRHVYELPHLLKPGDILVFNDSKVFRARLAGIMRDKPCEVFLLHADGDTTWQALLRPARRAKRDTFIHMPDGSIVTIIEKHSDGTVTLDMHRSSQAVFTMTESFGQVPVPPYVTASTNNTEGYQTTYAKIIGSVAAPTAGLHFTSALFGDLTIRGIDLCFVTLHVGLGTFRPMQGIRLEDHKMHSEWAHIDQDTWRKIMTAKREGRRIIAVGTTTTRTLESAASHGHNPYSDWTDMFIMPGYEFKVIDGLITNFHLPKSTLLVLVSAFAGRDNVLHAYQHAIENDYRFYSFGDAMLIV